MKIFKLITFAVAFTFVYMSAAAQNVSLNILTQNSGLVNIGGTVFLQVDIANNDAATSVPSYKLRPQISVPSAIVNIPATGHNLPSGWTITFNSGFVIRLSNGTDQVPPNTTRTILIALQGNAIGGPSTISGNLLFSNGVAPGASSGVALPGDNTADNTSTSTVEVTSTVPVTLSNFNAVLTNCKPVLNWITETEINSDRFEIERTNQNTTNWVSVGTVNATGYSFTKKKYNFIDDNITASTEKILYRLKIIDKDGRYKYSDVLPVFINCKASGVKVYPNPVVNSNLYVSVNGAGVNTEARLISIAGQLVLKSNLLNGTNSLDISNIASGQYILSVNLEDGSTKKVKVIIQ